MSWTLPWQIGGVHLEADLPRIVTAEAPVVFDIGANEGQTIEMMRRLFPRAAIYAFEPSGQTFPALSARYQSACSRIMKVAIGDRDEETAFTNYTSSLFSSLHQLDSTAAQYHDVAGISVLNSEPVVVRKLDTLVPELPVDRIDLLKIDTQGHDLAVLRGGVESLRSGKVGAVLVEVNFLPMYENEGRWLDVATLLGDAGFRLVDFYEKHRAGHLLAWCNCLFVRAS